MRNIAKFLTVAVALAMLCSGLTAAVAQLGKAAPGFTLIGIDGKQYSLSEFKGRTVVLEWVNPECPFVQKHYDRSGNIPETQKAATSAGVVWLSINSTAPGKEGDYEADRARAWQTRHRASPTSYLRDPDGKVGKLYDARTTPHLFIIDGEGTLVYAGGIDSIRSSRVEDIAKATNYVNEALADLKAGRAVRTSTSKPYGCAVKY